MDRWTNTLILIEQNFCEVFSDFPQVVSPTDASNFDYDFPDEDIGVPSDDSGWDVDFGAMQDTPKWYNSI